MSKSPRGKRKLVGISKSMREEWDRSEAFTLRRWISIDRIDLDDFDSDVVARARQFATRIVQAECKGRKRSDKIGLATKLYCALLQMHKSGGAVGYVRNRAAKNYSLILCQVVEAFKNGKWVDEFRSKPGGNKMSRLIATKAFGDDIDDVSANEMRLSAEKLVELRDADGNKLAFSFEEQLWARRVQRALERINRVNRNSRITYRPYDPEARKLLRERREVRSDLVAKFTGDFDHHGRMYRGDLGHQSLRKVERQSIQFDGKESVEVDFSALHGRMVYHAEGLECPDDPYSLWGDDTTDLQRRLVKATMLRLLNCASEADAINSCQLGALVFRPGKPKIWKRGRDREDAEMLREAREKTGLTFQEIVKVIKKRHARIKHRFCQNRGMELMRIDSEIALKIMLKFAKKCIPCLGVHDSFIVPVDQERQLRRVMMREYQRKLGFLPVLHD